MNSTDANAQAQEVRTRCHTGISEQTFRTMPEHELMHCLDAFAYTGGGPKRGYAEYRNELSRRETERQSKRLEDLTRRLYWLTVWIAALTGVLVVLELLPRIVGADH